MQETMGWRPLLVGWRPLFRTEVFQEVIKLRRVSRGFPIVYDASLAILASMLHVVWRPLLSGCFLLLAVMPFAPSSVLATSSKARSY